MRQLVHPEPYKLFSRELDIESAIGKMQGSIALGVTEPERANEGILMIDTDNKPVIKIGNSLHELQVEDNIIKFKEI